MRILGGHAGHGMVEARRGSPLPLSAGHHLWLRDEHWLRRMCSKKWSQGCPILRSHVDGVGPWLEEARPSAIEGGSLSHLPLSKRSYRGFGWG